MASKTVSMLAGRVNINSIGSQPSLNKTPSNALRGFKDEFASLPSSQNLSTHEYRHQFTIEIKKEVEKLFFSQSQKDIGEEDLDWEHRDPDDLDLKHLSPEQLLNGFQDVCREVGIDPPDSVPHCQQALRGMLVNIIDLIDAVRAGDEVQVWDPETEWDDFVEHTFDGRIFEIHKARDHPLLSCFLQKLNAKRPHLSRYPIVRIPRMRPMTSAKILPALTEAGGGKFKYCAVRAGKSLGIHRSRPERQEQINESADTQFKPPTIRPTTVVYVTDVADDVPISNKPLTPSVRSQPSSRFVYAVAKGRKPGIYASWDAAKENVNGYPGAIHRKFKTRAEAEEFVREFGGAGANAAKRKAENGGVNMSEAAAAPSTKRIKIEDEDVVANLPGGGK